MEVIVTEPARIALRTLSSRDRRKVENLIHHLGNWKTDAVIRDQSKQLATDNSVYVLKSTTDWRIFFTFESDQVVVLDVTKKSVLDSFAKSSHGHNDA